MTDRPTFARAIRTTATNEPGAKPRPCCGLRPTNEPFPGASYETSARVDTSYKFRRKARLVVNTPKDSITFVPRQRRSADLHDVPVLIVVGSIDAPSLPAEERVIPFEQRIFIGRREKTDSGEGGASWLVRDRMISGQHASIARVGSGFELTDLGSTNGTIVDGVMAQPRAALRDGALIFIGGHVAMFRVISSTERAAIKAELERPLGPVPTANPAFALVCAKLRKLAESDSEVLLTGETGAGKEVYAHAMHEASGRKGRFVAVNCAAIPRELVESELFGYVRGAHSQALAPKAGIIEDAEGGTLFLDEIGDMAPELQTKLLRFTQDRLLIPVGGTRARRIDARILAATSRTAPPTQSGGSGLRADLAARLGAEAIRIPPLRERIEDIGSLVVVHARPRRSQARARGFPGVVPLHLARQCARARQGRGVGGGAVTRRRSNRRRAPAVADRVDAAANARFAIGARVAPTAHRARARAAHAPVQRQHAACRARAGAQAGAGLPLGQAIQAQRRRLPQERRMKQRIDRRACTIARGERIAWL